MAYEDSNSSGEHFDSTPPATDDEYESDAGATFFIASKTWTSEQKKILQSRLDDWKHCKSAKSKKLIIEGALKELGALLGVLPIDEMKLVHYNSFHLLYAYGESRVSRHGMTITAARCMMGQ